MPLSAPELLRTLGLRVDGPGLWDRPIRSDRPGVFVLEVPASMARAPVDLSLVGRWLEQVSTLLVDGSPPTGKSLAARLARFWIPDHQVVFVGQAPDRISASVAGLVATKLGDPLPDPRARWLRTIRDFERTRVWWAETAAAEEFEDALLDAFAEQVPEVARKALHDPSLALPFANLRTTTGREKAHGISGDLLPEPPPRPEGPVVALAPVQPEVGPATGRGAHAVGTGKSRPPRPAPQGAMAGRAIRPARAAAATAGGAASAGAPPTGRETPPVYVSPAGLEKLRAELAELTTVQRPEVIHRVRAARELGDLRENADYESARKEQSFIEGRIATLDGMIRHAVIIEEPASGGAVALGSTIVVEAGGEAETYTVVGSTEADPASGRISNTSPLGRALLGHRAGDEVIVHTPGGPVAYRVLEVG
jgi:transcription elongation factor GreA